MAPRKEGNETGKSGIKRVDKCKTITVPNGLLVYKTTKRNLKTIVDSTRNPRLLIGSDVSFVTPDP